MAVAFPKSHTQLAPPRPLSWAATLAALTAFFTLAVTYGAAGGPDRVILFALMGLLGGLRLTRRRLPPASWAHWALRVALFVPIAAANWDKFNDPQSWLFDTSDVGAFGILAAAELVVQAARTVPDGQSSSGAICLLSGYVFLAACTTDQVWPIRFASPLYFALAVLSLPRFEMARQAKQQRQMEDDGSERRRAAAIALALALGLGINLLFWAFRVPLMQLGAGGLRDRPAAEATGVSVQPSLEPTFGLRGSTVRVLRVENDSGQAYLRGLSFDTYTHGRWGPIADRRHFSADALVTTLQRPPPTGAMTITTLAPVRGLLFVPLGTTGLFVPGDLPVQHTLRGGGYFVRAAVPPPYRVSFQGTDLQATEVLSAQERARDLAVPPDLDPRVLALAQTLTRSAPTPAAKAAAVQAFFLQNFQYSLTIHPGPGDPVSDFVLTRKAAHCEFFASAAVLMLRAAGLPARYVTGYYAHELDGPHTTLVRQQDAHAWAEVWLAPQGWTTLDATPAAGRPPATAIPVSAVQRAGEWIGDQVAAVRAWLGQFTTGQILGALAVLVAVPWMVRQALRFWRRPPPPAPAFAYAPPADLDALARRFEAWLRRMDCPCPSAMPWAEHVQASALPEEAQAEAQAFVRRYNAARFGKDASPSAPELADALQRLEQSRGVRNPATV